MAKRKKLSGPAGGLGKKSGKKKRKIRDIDEKLGRKPKSGFGPVETAPSIYLYDRSKKKSKKKAKKR